MTPLIGVLLVLFVMSISRFPKQDHELSLTFPPGYPSVPATEPVVVHVDIGVDGTIWWNRVAVLDRAELDARLAALAAQSTGPEIYLRPDRLTDYKYVAGLMSSAQRHGIRRIAMIVGQQSE